MTDTAPAPNARFFRGIDWSAFWTACIATFVVYFCTLAPTVTLEDSGELAVAGDYLGVPHPPGYPIWSIMAFVFTKIFSFVKYMGQPNPAWSIGLMSAVFGALAAGVSAMLICRSGSDILRELRSKAGKELTALEQRLCWVGGVGGSLVFAFSPAMWSQSVIVEVYSLNAFFLVLVFLLTYWWLNHPTTRLLCMTAFVFGLGLTNYQVLLLAALPLAFAILLRKPALFRDFLITGLPFVLVFLLVNKGVLPPIKHPLHATAFIYVTLNFLALGLSFFLLPNGRTAALTILLAELGVAFYAYMPIVSDLRNPPMNWGYPRTWEGFMHALTRGQYEKIKPADVLSAKFIHQIGSYLTDLRVQFSLPVALLGFLPFTMWKFKTGRRQVHALYVAITLSLAASGLVLLEELFFSDGIPAVTAIYKSMIFGVIALLLPGGLAIAVNQVRALLPLSEETKTNTTPERLCAGILIVIEVLVALLLVLSQIFARGEEGAAPLVSFTMTLSMLVVMAILAVIAWQLLKKETTFNLSISHNPQQWFIATMLGFLVMSIMLIALANPKGDIQDYFIQRVKFISSHALFAFWIGYGVILALSFVERICGERSLIPWLGILGALIMLPAFPLLQNAYNHELVRISGGAEQNGHDFGWQFGNYQLRGAEAVTEELGKEEEPLPNPMYPEKMTQDAIFFGGTDPGRFVPTYMIYSARVREDVYLITQNALADNTYMAVMRDLYGDQIWIPAQPDSARAFQRYVEDVKTGRRPRNADLRIENGRVQITGALGVMEINGILAEMIFEHNNFRHDFYVEESYVIRWMYPYLSPHGLIMKINQARQPRLDPVTIRNDADFWDWYTRRLNRDPKFGRDVVARKSFSKLRSAIGGLYANRRVMGQAENAFKQARLLYPLSPEANFRLVQEVFMPYRRYTEAREIMEDFGEQDPGNTRVPQLMKHLSRFEELNNRIRELSAKQKEGRIDVNTALELATCYRDLQMKHQFEQTMKGILATPNLPFQFYLKAAEMLHKTKSFPLMLNALTQLRAKLPANTPPEAFLQMARMYASANRPDEMKQVVEEYLKRKPDDWRAWLDLAALELQVKNRTGVTRALERALQKGGSQARAAIQKDKRFAPILKDAETRTRNIMGLGR